jgi:hypothetical protein
MMSDHGQNLGMARTWKMEPLDLLVPFWIYLPDSVKSSLSATQIAALHINKHRITTTVDFYPTLMDLLNITAEDLKIYNSPESPIPFLTGNR